LPRQLRDRVEREVPARNPPEFDARLETILYSPDRKLAIVDGRIVQVGDEIPGARIVDITPGVVFVRDSTGEERTLLLAAGR
jgi:hypothetical protein